VKRREAAVQNTASLGKDKWFTAYAALNVFYNILNGEILVSNYQK